MADNKTELNWHPLFKQYMENTVKHPNYLGLKFNRKSDGSVGWIATKKSPIGKDRLLWAENKARSLNIPIEAGVYAKVMLAVHPTKEKPCQICGKTMSLYYIYPNKNFVTSIKKTFNLEIDTLTSLPNVIKYLQTNNIAENTIRTFLIKTFKLSSSLLKAPWDDIVTHCELACRNGSCNKLGPGAMSNFPDRLDGFHTYNRCCRQEKDKGRHADNLKTYNKDRRAYEYWSDGNIHAANKFMRTDYFKGESADHIGPISLGFKHDPLLLQKMPTGDNSSKRDRLSIEDINKLISIEELYDFTCISWFSQDIWSFIKKDYVLHPTNIELYRDMLKQSMTNYMHILWTIKHTCKKQGVNFLIEFLLKPNFEYFNYDYSFTPKGEIVAESTRNFTDATAKETERYIRIAIDSLDDYCTKENRNLKHTLDTSDLQLLKQTCQSILSHNEILALSQLRNLVAQNQSKIIKNR